MNNIPTLEKKVTRQEFVNSVNEVVQNYIDNFYDYDANPMLRVNPDLLLVEVENGYAFQKDLGYSDEVIEDAAYAEGDATMSNTDNQAKQNYDYYEVRGFIAVDAEHQGHVDEKAVNALADKYFAAK